MLFRSPRHLIHLIFHGTQLKPLLQNIENPSIYDPCMGTGGFLTRLYKLMDMKDSSKVYGCETEGDTIKFAHSSLLLTTKQLDFKIKECDSLWDAPDLLSRKYDAIITNPPFGTKMDYQKTAKVKQGLKELYEKKYPETNVKFSDIYPIKKIGRAHV